MGIESEPLLSIEVTYKARSFALPIVNLGAEEQSSSKYRKSKLRAQGELTTRTISSA